MKEKSINTDIKKSPDKDIEKKLKELGIERDSEGKIILYHVTLAKYFPDIVSSQSLKPRSMTGNMAWSLKSEWQNEGKNNKVYLTTKDQAENIANLFQEKYGGTVYVLEAHADESSLLPDEDNIGEGGNWLDSLMCGDLGRSAYGRTCSYKGEVSDVTLYKTKKFEFSSDEKSKYIAKSVKALESGNKSLADETFQQYEEDVKKAEMLEQEKIQEKTSSKLSAKQ